MADYAAFDRIGYWSELKLEIIKKYATAYSTVLSSQRNPSFRHIYIEGFVGPGIHQSKLTDGFVLGSPLNALNVVPPFYAYHLIDIEEKRIKQLRSLIGKREDVFLYRGDCNSVLLENVFPLVKFEEYRRALCILDPYGMTLDWNVLATAARMESIEIFLNFPVMGMNRNALRRDPAGVAEASKERMNKLWGDNSWPQAAYGSDLFGNPDKQSNETVARAFQKRLKEVAGFARVPDPIPMRNSKGAVLYYLFFAAHKAAAEHIVLDIFRQYRDRGAR